MRVREKRETETLKGKKMERGDSKEKSGRKIKGMKRNRLRKRKNKNIGAVIALHDAWRIALSGCRLVA